MSLDFFSSFGLVLRLSYLRYQLLTINAIVWTTKMASLTKIVIIEKHLDWSDPIDPSAILPWCFVGVVYFPFQSKLTFNSLRMRKMQLENPIPQLSLATFNTDIGDPLSFSISPSSCLGRYWPK